MLVATISVTALGAGLGIALGIASRFLRVEEEPLVAEITAMMPGTNCGQCGFPGCAGAASAIAEGVAPPTCCPPGGKALAQALAARLGIEPDLSGMTEKGPQLAAVAEDLCIGCCRCLKVCPTDAIVGAAKQIHSVLKEACTGCEQCVDRCPTEAIAMVPVPPVLQHWVWPKPALA